jgi:hypothetical protein
MDIVRLEERYALIGKLMNGLSTHQQDFRASAEKWRSESGLSDTDIIKIKQDDFSDMSVDEYRRMASFNADLCQYEADDYFERIEFLGKEQSKVLKWIHDEIHRQDKTGKLEKTLEAQHILVKKIIGKVKKAHPNWKIGECLQKASDVLHKSEESVQRCYYYKPKPTKQNKLQK